jgi:hypothetical protein
MELIILAVVFLIIGVVLGIRMSDLFHKHMMAQILKELGIRPEQMRDLERRLAAEIIEEEADPKIVRVYLEQHQGTLFAYRESDKQFLGQGASQEDLVKSIGSRLRGVTIEITNGELLQKSHG